MSREDYMLFYGERIEAILKVSGEKPHTEVQIQLQEALEKGTQKMSNHKQIRSLEKRIARLEKQASLTLTASEKSWLAQKFEDLKNWVVGTRNKNKKASPT